MFILSQGVFIAPFRIKFNFFKKIEKRIEPKWSESTPINSRKGRRSIRKEKLTLSPIPERSRIILEESKTSILSKEQLEKLNLLKQKLESQVSAKRPGGKLRHGSLWKDKKACFERKERIALGRFKLNKEQKHGKSSPAGESATQKTSLCFNLLEYYQLGKLLAGEIKTGDGCILICNENGIFDHESIRLSLLSSNIDSTLHSKISLAWISNHVRLITQKLVGYSTKLNGSEGLLNPENLLSQLRYRADLEFIEGKRSILYRIAEGDVVSSIPIVLFITAQNTLSDGWYQIKFKMDSNSELMKRVKVGSKLLVCNLEPPKGTKSEAGHPLENQTEYVLNPNSVKLARWDLKLGQWNEERLGPVPSFGIDAVELNCGPVFRMRLQVLRAYPLTHLIDDSKSYIQNRYRRKTLSCRQLKKQERSRDEALDKYKENIGTVSAT